MLDPLWHAPLPAAETGEPPVIALRRIVWEAGAVLAVTPNPAAWFLSVEGGTLRVASGTGPSTPTGPDGEAVLAPGDAIAVPAGAEFAARNAGTARATVLAVAAWLPLSASPGTSPGTGGSVNERQAARFGLAWDAAGAIALAPGVTARVLTTASDVPVPAGATLAMGQVALAPGAALSLPAAEALVVAVEAGAIGFGAEGAIAWTIGVDGLTRQVPDRVAVATGEAALVTTGPVGLWQDGPDPAVLLVLVVRTTPD